MKNKTPLFIAIAVLLFIVLGIAIYLQVFAKKSNEQTKVIDPIDQQVKVEPTVSQQEISGSFLDLLKMNKSLECRFTYSDTESNTSGVTYISGNKLRGEFTAVQNGTEVNSFMVSDGEYFYTWSSSMPNQGFKLKVEGVTNTKEEDGEKSTSKDSALSTIDKNYTYSCKPWAADNSKFLVPTDVTFTDFSSMMQTNKEDSQKAIPDLCKTCDSLTDTSAKEQCKIQLKCN